jgi:acyl carrier protein
VAPRTPTEESLVAIWQDVLKIARVGVEDNFFDLGGHSLLVMQVVSRAERALGITMPVRSFFELPTIAALAADIERRGSQVGPVLLNDGIKVAARGAHGVRVTALDPLAGEEHAR